MFPFRAGRAALFSILTLATAGSTAAGDAAPAGDPAAGRVLFEQTWTTWQGLGPFFNERSCVACHFLGGVGGGGPNAKNVELLSVDVPGWIRAARSNSHSIDRVTAFEMNEALGELEKNSTKLLSGLKNGTTVLHTFCDDEQYQAYREALLGLPSVIPVKMSSKRAAAQAPHGDVAEPRHLSGPEPIKRIVQGDVPLLLSGRNSTAMFGAGVIDRISDAEMEMVVADEALRYPTMAGRFLGRFGWRGQTKTLAQFVGGACTVELGLEVPHIDEPEAAVADPAGSASRIGPGSRRPIPKPAGPPTATLAVGNATPEISRQEFQDLVAFVASLPTPTRLAATDEAQADRIAKGEEVFTTIGCAICHRPSLGTAHGIYSDLLVHEMGPRLADSQPAPLKAFRQEYYGSSESLREAVDPKRLAEWRTPPLWGVADSAPYLHDGRAPTVEAAILAHGGQGEASAVNYARLPTVERRQLLEFLSTLVAPETPERLRTLTALQTAAAPQAAPQQPVAADPRQQAELAERAARGRLRLATAALERGDREAARAWLVALVEKFPRTAAAAEARRSLEALGPPAAETEAKPDDGLTSKSD